MSEGKTKTLTLSTRYVELAKETHNLLSAYCNTLAARSNDAKNFVVETWQERREGFKFLEVVSSHLTFKTYAESSEFADVEAKFIHNVDQHFIAARVTLIDLIEHRRENLQSYSDWPDTEKRLREIYHIIDNDLLESVQKVYLVQLCESPYHDVDHSDAYPSFATGCGLLIIFGQASELA